VPGTYVIGHGVQNGNPPRHDDDMHAAGGHLVGEGRTDAV
jgi:hypothetical protein